MTKPKSLLSMAGRRLALSASNCSWRGEGWDGGREDRARRGSGRLRLLLNVHALLEAERPGEAAAARAQAEAVKDA